jgi:Zn-dependent peptidase ImmA (M78 family)
MEWVEQRAEAILSSVPEWIWDGESVPVPVDDIVDSCFGLHVMDVEDMTAAPGSPALQAGQALSGLLLPDRKQIWCNASEGVQWPPRRRFTIAHELGHWCLHRPGQQSLFCRRAMVAPEDLEAGPTPAKRPPLPEIEKEANAFAAALLMPARLIERHYYETGRSFERMCELFGSSQAAMGRRLHAVI